MINQSTPTSMGSSMPSEVSYRTAPNIALIKYWGKHDEDEILPVNDSVGLTLNCQDLSTTTTCKFDKRERDTLTLNGKVEDISWRVARVLGYVRREIRKDPDNKYHKMEEQQWRKYHFEIVSTNSFPTASGVASSSAGLACLAAALNALFGGKLKREQLSRLARWGSGSASRAVEGGLVEWKGVEEKHLRRKERQTADELERLSKRCIATMVIHPQNLTFIKVVMLLTDNRKKDVSSTSGMRLSVQTSEFIGHRNRIARQRISDIRDLLDQIVTARKQSDQNKEYALYSKFAQLTIRDSNNFHAICLDTYPPIFYLNDFSRQVISIVDHIINPQSQTTKVAYSFDAGAHAVLFVHEDMLQDVLFYLNRLWKLQGSKINPKGAKLLQKANSTTSRRNNFENYQGQLIPPQEILVTDVGKGAQQVSVKTD